MSARSRAYTLLQQGTIQACCPSRKRATWTLPPLLRPHGQSWWPLLPLGSDLEYTALIMIDLWPIYLTKAEESLRGAESEFAQGRHNNAANRCYYVCFQAAVVALHHAGLAPRGGRTEWGHAFVQAEFVGRLIHRRRLYPTSLRQVLARNLTLRHTADYASDLVTQTQVARALQRAQDFLTAIREQVRAHESGTT
jgi:uncharacterized protein (UPF0332 family)